MRKCFLTFGLLAAVPAFSHAALLTYWNFNNGNPNYNGSGGLGSFSLSAAAYGETYNSSNNTLSSNTANNTVFHGSGISLDFTNLLSGVNNANNNGKAAAGGQTQTNTVFGGFGAFADTTGNRASTDSTTGNSMIIMNPSGTELTHYITLSLSSAGYNALVLSYDTRASNGFAGSEDWSYSLNGTTFSSLSSVSVAGNATFATKSLDLSSLSSNALNNTGTFYLRMTLNSTNNGGSYAFDNLQLNGTAIPEPAALAPVCGGLLLVFARRKRSATAAA